MSTFEVCNPFVRPSSEYKRDLNFLSHYVDQIATLLVKMRGVSMEYALEYVKSKLTKGGECEFKDIPLTHTQREKNGDRFKREGGLYRYIREAIRDRNIIAPTLTRYHHPSVLESPLSRSIDRKVALRNVNKGLAKEAEMAKNWDLFIRKNNEQTGNKLSNNALSGAHVSSGTPLSNKSAHSTLTSTCRLTSGFGNANNEKMVAGNRHYRLPSIVINNILSTIKNTDYVKLKATMEKYNLVYPSTDDVMVMVRRCTGYYWRSEERLAEIAALLDKLEPVERAAFLYTGDFYHIRKHNSDMVRTFLEKLSTRITTPLPMDEATRVIKASNGDYMSLANQLQGEEMKGVSVSNARENNPKLYGQIAATLVNINDVLREYSDFIDTFFVTTNLPASIAYLPTMIRETAITSDTDSTIFTVQDWAKWYEGDYVLNDRTLALGAAVCFVTSQSITHILAIMSANIGVEDKRLHQIAMKNEFRFDVYFPTFETKHYYSIIGCKEGNVYSEYKQERKGVHLRNSAIKPAVMKRAANMMKDICERIARNTKINIHEVIQAVADQEIEIIEDIRSGKSNYFKYEKVNTAESYKLDETRSKFASYTLWRDVFAPKYGDSETPPYVAYKVNTILRNKTLFTKWLENMKDQALADRLRDWMIRNNKERIETFYLPATVIYANGIPEEIFELIDIRRIVSDNISVFYKVMETLGYFQMDKKINRLVSDQPEYSVHSENPELKAFHSQFEDVAEAA